MGDNLFPINNTMNYYLIKIARNPSLFKILKKIEQNLSPKKISALLCNLRGATSIRLRSNRSPVGVIPCVTFCDRITEIYTGGVARNACVFLCVLIPVSCVFEWNFSNQLRHFFYASSITVQLAQKSVITQLLSLEEKVLRS